MSGRVGEAGLHGSGVTGRVDEAGLQPTGLPDRWTRYWARKSQSPDKSLPQIW